MHLSLQIAAWLIAVAWLSKLIEAAHGLGTVPNLLAPEYDVVRANQPSVTVIVPARNEAASVAACLDSLLNQDHPGLSILAVDDRSSDRTGAIMDELAQTHPGRVEVLHIVALPSGWLGKTHAMASAARRGTAASHPDYLLFTDADVIFRPDAIRRALACASASHADHFVVLPTAVVRGRGEGMLLAYLQVIGLWAVRTWRVADPDSMRDAIGVGAFNLIRTDVYEQLGGFDAVPMEIVEDLSLGRRVKRAGLRQRVATAPGMVGVHWAAGVRGIALGMTKNLFAVFHFEPALLLGAAAWIALFSIAPATLLAVHGARLPALLTLASVAGLYILSSRSSRISPWYALLSPAAAAVVIYAMLRSMLITLREGGVTWRGTFYTLAELRKSTGRQL